jgi:hypothetical protein
VVKTWATFRELPITAVQPEGWLRRYLEKQRDGLTGHLEASGFPFNTRGWLARTIRTSAGTGWWPYEQIAYWLDGMVRAGLLLRDEFLVKKARRQLDHVLAHPDADGYLGPPFMKDPTEQNRWPHAVLFRALMALHSATGDARIVRAVKRHYLADFAAHGKDRNVCNVEPMLWAYAQTGDRRLLDRALAAYREFNRLSPEHDAALETLLSPKRPTEHGVTYNEIAKLGAVLYIYTGKERYLDATVAAYRKLDEHCMLIDGVCSSSEALRGKDPLDSHETCDIADYTWGVGNLLLATGRAEYADKIERACFNAAPGAITNDFRALQYFSCPNQVIADRASNHNLFYRGAEWMSYRPCPGTACCPGEVNRIMPNYAARMWLRDGRGGLVAALYGPSRITAVVGRAEQEVTVVEETGYPFAEHVEFQVRTARPVAFPFSVRIPRWCRTPRLLLNGRPVRAKLTPGTFVTLRRTFRHNDRVTLELPMVLKLSRWPRGGLGIERGPLVYALRIEEDWRVDRRDRNSTKDFPAWNLYPASRWNYALAVDERTLARDVQIVRKPLVADPWSIEAAPIELRVPARRVAGWRIQKRKSLLREICIETYFPKVTVKGRFSLTPQLADAATLGRRLGRTLETVTLVPYGCTHLRIAIFPHCKSRRSSAHGRIKSSRSHRLKRNTT